MTITIQDVENMSAEEIKEQAGQIEADLMSVDHEDLVSRYRQARGDAKVRDEKLAAQAQTLGALQDGLTAVKEQAATAAEEAAKAMGEAIESITDIGIESLERIAAKDEEIKELAAHLADTNLDYADRSCKLMDDHKAQLEKSQAQIDSAKHEIQTQCKALDRRNSTIAALTTQANKYNEAITSIQKLSLDAINAKAVVDASA